MYSNEALELRRGDRWPVHEALQDSAPKHLAAVASTRPSRRRRPGRAPWRRARGRVRDHGQPSAVPQPGQPLPPAHREEEIELAKRIERGDLEAKERLINSNLRLVIKFARRYQGHGLPLQDLVQEAMLGLIRAAEKFDWRRGYKFSTYAVLWIKQAIQRGLDNTGRPVRIPAHVAQRERTVNRIAAELSVRLNRDPTDEEVAERAKLPLDEVKAIRDLTRVTTSLDAPVGDGDTSLGELRTDSVASVEDEILERQQESAVGSCARDPAGGRAASDRASLRDRRPSRRPRCAKSPGGSGSPRSAPASSRRSALRRLAADDSLAAWRRRGLTPTPAPVRLRPTPGRRSIPACPFTSRSAARLRRAWAFNLTEERLRATSSSHGGAASRWSWATASGIRRTAPCGSSRDRSSRLPSLPTARAGITPSAPLRT